jgi:hypothetical protein
MEGQEHRKGLLLKNVRWDRIREAIERQKETGFPIDDVDEMVNCINR